MFKLHPGLKEYYYPTQFVEIDKNMVFARGGSCNAVILTSDDKEKILIIDVKSIRAKQLKLYVDSINPNAEVTIILTHYHIDHLAGIKKYPKAYTIAGNYSDEDWKKTTGLKFPSERLDVNNPKTIKWDNEEIYIENVGIGHTRNDVIVYFKNRKILVTGDLVYVKFHPVLNSKYGANLEAWTEKLDYLNNSFDYKQLLPGHGGISSKNELLEMQGYLKDLLLAAKDDSKIEELKAKYEEYLTVPFFIGLKKNIKYARKTMPTLIVSTPNI